MIDLFSSVSFYEVLVKSKSPEFLRKPGFDLMKAN